ncbi:MAG: Gfo/Idh/MocA family oxidoreductase [Thermaceae bacterium]|nr:Gfo/Idh/MocA family oxidoreductase [Thermaceae bacterium]
MAKVKTIVVGTGSMARGHIRTMLDMQRSTLLVGFVEPSEASRAQTQAIFAERGRGCPPFYDSIQQLIEAQGSPDAALIATPHKYHLENARDCLLGDIDVCLEKPMVMNVAQARELIALRDKTRRLVMVAFPGSLSPAIWEAKRLIVEGTLGKITAIAAFAYQHWKQATQGTWRQNPEISGGGFLFDTGSHMVNTVVDLLGEDVAQVRALFDNRGTPVEIASSVSGVSKSGVLFSLTGAGDSIQCNSEITVFGDRAVLKTGIWGESLALKKQNQPEFVAVKYRPSKGPWEQFLKVRGGKMENPCPPEVGLRFAKLMDMIRQSADLETPQTAKRGRARWAK